MKRVYGLRHALLALLARVVRAVYSDERHLIITKDLNEDSDLDGTEAFAVQPLETRTDLERAAARTEQRFLRQPVLANHLENGYFAQLASASRGEPLGYLWWAAKEINDEHPDVILHGIDLAEDDAYIFSLFVAPPARGQQVAPALLRHTEAALRDRGHTRMVGWVDATNRPARWFFATSGFNATETVRIRFVLSLLAFSRGRVLVRNVGLLSRHRFGYRVVLPNRTACSSSVAKPEQ